MKPSHGLSDTLKEIISRTRLKTKFLRNGSSLEKLGPSHNTRELHYDSFENVNQNSTASCAEKSVSAFIFLVLTQFRLVYILVYMRGEDEERNRFLRSQNETS